LPEVNSRIPERTQISYVTYRNHSDPLTPYQGTDCTFLFMQAAHKPMTIGQVAKLSSVNVETIRFYERERLLTKPKRKESGYRLFEAEVVSRIKFIKKTKHLRFSLKEIRELLSLRVNSQTSATEVKKRIESKIEQIDRRIYDLKKVRNALAQLSRSVRKSPISELTLLEVLEKSGT